MKKFVIYISFVVMVAIICMSACDILNQRLLLASSVSDLYKMNRLFLNASEGEIAILGSSRAEECFVPSRISPKAFNYGLNGSRFNETVFHLEQVVERHGDAPIIVNLDPWGFGVGIFRGDYRFVSKIPAISRENGVEYVFTSVFPGFRFYGELRRNLAGVVRGGSKTIDNGAILLGISRSEEEWQYIAENFTVQKYAEDAGIKKRLADVLASNTSHEIVFVVAPIMKCWWDKFEGKENFVRLKEWLLSFPHVRVVDYSHGYGYGEQDFFDPIHLNERGARRFSYELGKLLRKEKLIDGAQ